MAAPRHDVVIRGGTIYDGSGGKPYPGEVAIDDITPAICFLLSDEAKRITGAELAVDGGWTAGKHCPGLPGF